MADKITYRDAGVDIDAGNDAVLRIKKILEKTSRIVPGGEGVSGIGGFAGLFKPYLDKYEEPLFVAATDGVGTKLLIALEHNRLETIGQDLVAMCVNDLIVSGARPLFFLDYLATGKLDPEQVEIIVGSVNDACTESECLLIGGECAEMPGMYKPGHTDLAGFAVGVVDRKSVIDGSKVVPGDVVIGLESSGYHSNGYSLIRKVIEKEGWDFSSPMPGMDEPLIETVIRPTRLYVKPIMKLLESVEVKAMSHITGGGLVENIPRSIPRGLMWEVDGSTWENPEIFNIIWKAANLEEMEFWRTFNCGIGYAVIVAPGQVSDTLSSLKNSGEAVREIGTIVQM